MRTWTVVCVGALLLALGAARASAQSVVPGDDPEAARTHFKLGIDSYRDSDLPTALIEFKRAYAASPNYRVLFNLGQVCAELRDYPEAERYFNQYLKDGQSEIDGPRRQQVENELAKVKTRIASLVLSTNVENAEWFVDDVASGKSPMSDVVRVSAGRRRISAVVSGRPRATKVVDVAGGETVVVEVNIAAELERQPLAAAPSATAAHPESSNTAMWVMLVGTGAAAVGAGVVGFLAFQDNQGYKEELRKKTSQSELDSLAQGARTKAIISDALLGVAAVGAGITLYLALDSGTEKREHAHLQFSPTSVQLTQQF